MRSTIAKTLFETAVDSVIKSESKWNTANNTHALMYSLEEASGIPYYFVNLAVKEAVANRLLNDLFDICSRDLAQSLSARAHYKHGENPIKNTRHAVAQPIFDIVSKFIDRMTFNGAPADFNDRQGEWYDCLEANMGSIEAAYSPECCEMFREYIAASKYDRANSESAK